MKITAAASSFCKILTVSVKISLRETGARKRLEKTAEIRAERQKTAIAFWQHFHQLPVEKPPPPCYAGYVKSEHRR